MLLPKDVRRRGWAILGGTFDPIHNGHLALAKAVYEQIPVTQIRFMPALAPWQKAGRPISSAENRLTLVERAIQYVPYFQVDTRELRRSGPTYTIDTVKALRDEVGPAFPLVWIIGGDQWTHFSSWHRWSELLKYVHLAIVQREGHLNTPPELQSFFNEHVQPKRNELTQASGAIFTVDMPLHRASSTRIREAFSQGKLAPVEHWLAPHCVETVYQYHLYGTKLPKLGKL